MRPVPALLAASVTLLVATPEPAQDFLGGLLRRAAEGVATTVVSRAVDGAVDSVSTPPPASGTDEPRQAPPPSGGARVNYQGTPAEQEAFRLSNMQARGLPPPTGWYELRADLTREQNCEAMRAANQWTQLRTENPCRPM